MIAVVVGLGLVAAVVGTLALRHATSSAPTAEGAAPSAPPSAPALVVSAPPEPPVPSAPSAQASASAPNAPRGKGPGSTGAVDASAPPQAPDAGSRIREAITTCAVVQKGMPVHGADPGVASVNARVRNCRVDAANCLLANPGNPRREYSVAIQPGTKKAVAQSISQRYCDGLDYCVTNAVSMSPFVTVTADHFTLGCTITPIP
ncbi:MAG: hypothetical protein JNM74_02420 [Myxococcales bacterium]|nr:hypothetical protein [Myxococcales bacterium]